MKIDRLMMKRFFRWVCVGVAFVMVGWGISPYVGVGFNISKSVDGYVFVVLKTQEPKKGELAAFYPPKNDFKNDHYFVKYIVGEPGDWVVRKNRSFFINDGRSERYVGDAKELSLKGIKLEASESGLIPAGYVYVATEHKDSFDSRYKQIGWIPKSSIFGRAIRII